MAGRRSAAARRAEYCARARAPQVDRDGTIWGVRIGLTILGVLLVASGLVWIAQGLNLPWAPRSFMTADRTWVLIGAVTALAGAALIGWARQRG